MAHRRPLHSGDTENYLSPARPRVFAHRGLAVDAPENTLLSFAKAVAAGVIYIETDVHASADGVAIIAHDPDLLRVAGSALRVDQLTLAELERIDLGFGQSFCTLARALDTFPETRFNIDIKSLNAVAPTVRTVMEARASTRVLITSFDERRRVAALTHLPTVASSASASRSAAALLAARIGATPLLRHLLRDIDAVQIPEKAAGLRTTTPRLINMLHNAGVEVHVWTINDPLRMTQLLNLGVDGIITDRPDLALEIIAQRL
ncbi:MAG: glycerophosphodiester phosphodiesterase family protein [Rhodoglobus sp.]